MVKRASDQPHQRPNSNLRVRWVEVEVNGADTTIEEALRTVERMRRPVIEVAPPPPRIGHTTPASGDSAPPVQPTLFDNEEQIRGEAPEEALPFGTVNDVDEPLDSQRKKRGAGERRDRNAGIKPVGDIDFVPEGKQSLKDFFASKAPSSDMDQILVICHFLEHTLKAPQIGPGHLLSGFTHVNKPVPRDLKQTIRNMKERKAWLGFNDNDIENVRVTTEGDNRVKHELGKGNADAGAQ
jgi:hypothetical protein